MPEHRDPWTAFAGARPVPRLRNVAGETTWFNWTQYPEHGPGLELLGEPRTVLDLGCGSGRSTTHLAVRGARAVGVDFSPVLIGEAVSAGAAYRACAVERGAVDFLAETYERFDADERGPCLLVGTAPHCLRPRWRPAAARPGGSIAGPNPPICRHPMPSAA
ncbi:class I SAM-dependent methyltransferase [Streptomyces sp. NPDC052043]|uniref:class I SAM-dependent methyltransferase n=1 Tax=Streptomyces sp. NPDC052043 TaxID=3365684 RepID=UPI0037CF97CC